MHEPGATRRGGCDEGTPVAPANASFAGGALHASLRPRHVYRRWCTGVRSGKHSERSPAAPPSSRSGSRDPGGAVAEPRRSHWPRRPRWSVCTNSSRCHSTGLGPPSPNSCQRTKKPGPHQRSLRRPVYGCHNPVAPANTLPHAHQPARPPGRVARSRFRTEPAEPPRQTATATRCTIAHTSASSLR